MTKKRNILIVSKEEILRNDISGVLEKFKGFEADMELYRNTVDIRINGYNFDKRELHQIPEVRLWMQTIFTRINTWMFFLAMDESDFLKVQYVIQTDPVEISPGCFQLNNERTLKFIDNLFDGLNTFCDKHNISEDINIEHTHRLMKFLNLS